VASDDLLRKIKRSGPGPVEPFPAAAPQGTPPPAGHHRATLNFRQELWDALQAEAAAGGNSAVTVIEALVARYLDDDELRAQVDTEAALAARARRLTARRRP